MNGDNVIIIVIATKIILMIVIIIIVIATKLSLSLEIRKVSLEMGKLSLEVPWLLKMRTLFVGNHWVWVASKLA